LDPALGGAPTDEKVKRIAIDLRGFRRLEIPVSYKVLMEYLL
jgi:hypothetical protein